MMIVATAPETSSLRSVEEHRAVVAALLPAAPAEQVWLAEARGRVLAADLVATVSLPPFDNSAMDGYAVRAAELAGAGPEQPVELPVTADIPAGRTDVPALAARHRAPDHDRRAASGRRGRDRAGRADRRRDGAGAARRAAPAAGAHVRRTGEDVAAGSVVLPAGTVLGPAQIGLAAAVGAATLPVRRRPVVLVLSTGSELVAPGLPLRPGQIYESNGPMLAAAVQAAGGRAELLRFVPDDVGQFLGRLRERLAAGDVDLVLTSGGVSAGAYEVVKDAFAGRGVEFVKVGMQPGGPQGAGRVDELGGVPW